MAENAGHELVRCWNKISPRKEKKVREAKFSSVTARRDKYVNFYKRRGSLFKSTSFVSEDVREARMNPFI